jgi:hypothetical protein
MRGALVAGDVEGVKAQAVELASAAKESDVDAVANTAGKVAGAGDIEAARDAFAELSEAMIAYRAIAEETPKPQVVYCSMVKHSWLQPKGEVSNPYYADEAMRTCGEVKETAD